MMQLIALVLSVLLTSCIDTVPVDNAKCPCLKGYFCTSENVCEENEDVVAALKGQIYIVKTTMDQWDEPDGLAKAFKSDFNQIYPVFAFKIQDVDPVTMTFSVLLAVIHNGVQDMGLITCDIPGRLEIENGNRISFHLGPADLQTILFSPTQKTTLAWYYELTLSGTFYNVDMGVEEGTLSTIMNAGEYANLFYMVHYENGEEACKDFSTLGNIKCSQCPRPPHAPTCLYFSATDLSYQPVSNFPIEPVYTFDAQYL